MKTLTKKSTKHKKITNRNARTVPDIRNGSNCMFNGIKVRVIKTCNNGLRLVGMQGVLFGFAHDNELTKA